MSLTAEEIEILIKENVALKEENLQLKGNHEQLLNKFNDVINRLSKLEESSRPEKAPEHSTNSDDISKTLGDALNAADSIRQLQEGWSKAETRIENHYYSIDRQEQYTMKNSLIAYNLDDIPKKTYGLEFSKYVLAKLQTLLPSIANQLKLEDIDVSHPLPLTFKGKTRVIIKFVRRDVKNLVFYAKSELKKSPLKVTITEQLSKYNLWLLSEVRKMVSFKDTWTSQCVVFALVKGEKVAIKGQGDLKYVHQKVGYLTTRPRHVSSATDLTAAPSHAAQSASESSVALSEEQQKQLGREKAIDAASKSNIAVTVN